MPTEREIVAGMSAAREVAPALSPMQASQVSRAVLAAAESSRKTATSDSDPPKRAEGCYIHLRRSVAQND